MVYVKIPDLGKLPNPVVHNSAGSSCCSSGMSVCQARWGLGSEGLGFKGLAFEV